MRRFIGRTIAGVALIGAMLPAQAAGAAPAHSSQPSAAHVWVTTPDGSLRLSDQGSVPFTRTAPSALTITVDPSRTFQTMTGFGASITDSSASVLYRLGRAQRSQVMADLFDPVTGD